MTPTIYYDLGTKRWLSTPDGRALDSLSFKLRSQTTLEVIFLRYGVAADFGPSAAGYLGVKSYGSYTASYISPASSWTKTAHTGGYSFPLNFNTNEAIALLPASTPSCRIMLEVKWTDGTESDATNAAIAYLQNSVSNGNEGIPTQASQYATQAQAEAGSENTKWMTPLRTAQAIAKTLIGYATQSWVIAKGYATTAWVTAVISSLTKADVGLGRVDNTSDAEKPISTATQAALDGKQASGNYAAATHTHTSSQISDSTTAGRALLKAASASDQRTALGLGTAATMPSNSFDPVGAAQNAADYAVKRENHTGTQPASSIDGLSEVATTGEYSSLKNKPAIPVLLSPFDQRCNTAMTLNGPNIQTITYTLNGVIQGYADFTYDSTSGNLYRVTFTAANHSTILRRIQYSYTGTNITGYAVS